MIPEKEADRGWTRKVVSALAKSPDVEGRR